MKNKRVLIVSAYLISLGLLLAATFIGGRTKINFPIWFLIIAGTIGVSVLLRKENVKEQDKDIQ